MTKDRNYGNGSSPGGAPPSRSGARFRARLQDAFRPFSRFVVLLARAVAKVIATIWRLAGALDVALWNGTRLSILTLFRWSVLIGRTIGEGVVDLTAWLPTRAGKAYTAFSGVVLIVSALWIVDELRSSSIKRAETGDIQAPPVDANDPILARMEGRYVHLSDVEVAARAAGYLRSGEKLTPQAAFSRGLVDQYVEQRMLALAATQAGLHRDPTIALKLSVARDRILAASLLENQVANAVTDQQVLAIYNNEKDVTELGDEVRARHIVVEKEDEARSILAALEAGGDFNALARERSIDQATAPLGGEIGYFTRDMMTPILSNAAFNTNKGEIAPIFFTEFGWHILEVLDRRATPTVSLGDVENRIRRFLRLKTIQNTRTKIQDEYDVVYFSADQKFSPASAEDLNTLEMRHDQR